ncbi:hypothetical protein N9L17_03090 [Candidatus Pelagibacter bacterium]|jgi:hypothetical protein|nr:hypothetical protein [Candidatus Pelagibacter bacterium]|tara:strand:+ start:523 stop:786 length:264 start_codon:yes stop_codon:yes gene_type:complete
MQTAFFIVIGAIMVTVLFLAFRAIGRGMEARGELKRDGTLEKNKQDPYTFKSIQEDEDDKLLEKLKDKNLSEEDLKKLYEDLKNKKE